MVSSGWPLLSRPFSILAGAGLLAADVPGVGGLAGGNPADTLAEVADAAAGTLAGWASFTSMGGISGFAEST